MSSSSLPPSALASAAGARFGSTDAAGLETAQRIVETAERLYRQYGFQKTTVADIASELDMSPANVYRFFASKSAITEAVAIKVTGELEAVARRAATEPDLSPGARLARLLRETHRATVQRCLEDRRLHAMVEAAMEESWGVIEQHKTRMHAIVAALVAEGAASGEFVVEDAETAAHCFMMATITVLHPQLIEQCLGKGEDLEPFVEAILAFSFRALGARALPPP